MTTPTGSAADELRAYYGCAELTARTGLAAVPAFDEHGRSTGLVAIDPGRLLRLARRLVPGRRRLMQYDDDKDPGTAALAAVAGLARSVESLTRVVAAMKKGLQQTASAAEVARLAKVVTAFEELLTQAPTRGGMGKTAGPGSADPVRSWLRLAEDQAAVEQMLSELLPWMQTTYLRYGDALEALPPCWLWHPEIVEELLWLMDAWTAAYEGPDASNKLVGDWHDRQRPGVTGRLGKYAPGCDALAHRDAAGQPAVTVPLAADADPFVTWWVTGRDNNGPAPTAEQIKAGRRGGSAVLASVPDTAGGQR